MDSINNTTKVIATPQVQTNPEVQRNLKPNQSEFLQKFEKIKSDDVRSELEGIFKKIIEKSDSLKDNLSIKSVMEYKNLVKNFMEIAAENSHVFSQQSSLDRRGRHRVYSMIKQVYKELDSITKEFLTNHVDHAKVLTNIDVVRGMLIDIMG